MKRQFVLTPEAKSDLKDILLDIAEDGDSAEVGRGAAGLGSNGKSHSCFAYEGRIGLGRIGAGI